MEIDPISKYWNNIWNLSGLPYADRYSSCTRARPRVRWGPFAVVAFTVAAFASLVDAFSLWPVPVASLRRLVGIPGLAPSGVRTIANRDMPASAFGDRCGATITRHTN